ncbi:MAG: hypothetical protein VSS52_008245 [Thiotrichaceae bacterium]|nr:hypothetical protein [Thiotrichaceae bacterium]
MNKSLLFRQHGAVLLLMLILLMLAVTTVVLSALNDRHDYQLIQQQQTQRALHQAKQALIGFAAAYDKTHSNSPDAFVGYLPCPDVTGDGSAATCAAAGQTVLGRFPWRSLGVPPLYDGSGECLWYAVSGGFKNNPKTPITHDTDGDIIIKDVNGNILHGDTALNRAIAVVFAPNKPLSAQTRGGSSGTQTNCGYKNAPNAGSNQASNYLESIGGVNNATGGGQLSIYDTSNRIFRDADSDDENYPTFVQAATAYNSDGEEVFNDTTAIISAADFAPIYKLMDYRVVSKAATCIKQYSSDNRFNFLTNYSKPIGDWESPHTDTYRADVDIKAQIDIYLTEKISNCKSNDCNKSCDDICEAQKQQCTTQCDSSFPNDVSDALTCANDCVATESSCNSCNSAKATCEANCESAAKQENFYKTAIDISANYPWASGLDDASFKEQSGARFGRIPSVLDGDTTAPLTVSNLQNNDMSDSWSTNCFDESKWIWWKEWKDSVFYAFDDEYVTQSITQLWVKTERSANSIGSGANKVWTLEDRNQFLVRKAIRKAATIAKLTDSTAYDGWEKTTISATVSATSLKLSNIDRSFVVISAGRRLALNQGSSSVSYEPFTQIRDIKAFCDSYPALCSTCNATPDSAYISGCYKSRIDNYLEGDADGSLNLRKVLSGAMVGGNIPIDYTTQAVATIPTGDEAFIQEVIDMDFFTDYACYSASDCNSQYKK